MASDGLRRWRNCPPPAAAGPEHGEASSAPAVLGPNAVRQPLESSVDDPMHRFRETDWAPPVAGNENGVPRDRRRLRVLVCLASAAVAIAAMVRLVF
jgi:hypothetical protein